MDSFKTSIGFSKIHKITVANYELQTKKRSPFVREHNGKDSYYAVCPECDNPIQIVGLYKETRESGRKLYGRHHKGDVPYLAKYSEEDYLECPFSNPKWEKTPGKRSPNSPIANRILCAVKDQFDRVIYLLKRQTGIRIGENLAREMLKTYVKNEGWLFKEATLNNIPWIFGQCNPAISLFGRVIKKDSEIYKAIKEKCPEVVFLPVDESKEYLQIKNKNGQFITLYFTFLNHQKIIENNERVRETMDFMVFKEINSNENETEIIFLETLPIESEYFANLALSKKYEDKRNQDLLNLAEQVIRSCL